MEFVSFSNISSSVQTINFDNNYILISSDQMCIAFEQCLSIGKYFLPIISFYYMYT